MYIKDEVTVSDEEVILEWGKSLISFRCSENLKGQLSSCTFVGWDENNCEGITGSAGLSDIPVKVGGDSSWEDNSKGASGTWKAVFMADDLYDNEDAKNRAIGYLQNISVEYQTGVGKCEGNRHIFPGMRVTIKYVGEHFSGEYIAERVVHEVSVNGPFTTEVYVKRNMTAGGASHVPGAELAEQEGAGNTETEQAAAEEGDERAALYENEADDTAAAGEETVHSEAASADEENQTEEELLYGFGKIDSNYRGWTQQDDKWADNFLSNEVDEENIMGKQGCKVVAAAKMICTILGNDSFDPPRFIADGNRIVDSDGNLSQAAIIGAIKNAIAEAIPDAASRSEIKSDYFENQLNETVLKKLKNDPEYLNYILGRAHVGGSVGQHWVVIEDYTVLPDGTIEYQVVGSSKKDEGRIFRSDPNFATDSKKAYINKIEIYSVRRK